MQNSVKKKFSSRHILGTCVLIDLTSRFLLKFPMLSVLYRSKIINKVIGHQRNLHYYYFWIFNKNAQSE